MGNYDCIYITTANYECIYITTAWITKRTYCYDISFGLEWQRSDCGYIEELYTIFFKRRCSDKSLFSTIYRMYDGH